jgi:lipopolysaccharide/colanic/teichoic acid biosynthesis glycosyltransferase
VRRPSATLRGWAFESLLREPYIGQVKGLSAEEESVLNKVLGLKVKPRRERRLSTLPEEYSGLGMLPQKLFMKLLCLERKRTERSERRFVLMLLDAGNLLKQAKAPVMPNLVSAISQSTRDTDLMGWYTEGAIIGVIFTEIAGNEDKAVVQSLSAKLTGSLRETLSPQEMNEIKLSFHIFPEDWNDSEPNCPVTATLQIALGSEIHRKRVSLVVKRLIDIAGSVAGLILCLPVLVLIAIAIRLTSKGPVLFRQVRLGQYGKKFTFLKFRSMYVNSDPKIHEEYVKRLIQGTPGTEQTNGNRQILYKLTADPRITPVGRFLRSTSLDELPQFLNVLCGHMSLVGPRPPVLYEFNRYDLWHRQRLLAVRPGITGLWQVDGRSRVKFDDMVRLDIRYARSWSLWLDIRILLRTPRAVLSGNGAC